MTPSTTETLTFNQSSFSSQLPDRKPLLTPPMCFHVLTDIMFQTRVAHQSANISGSIQGKKKAAFQEQQCLVSLTISCGADSLRELKMGRGWAPRTSHVRTYRKTTKLTHIQVTGEFCGSRLRCRTSLLWISGVTIYCVCLCTYTYVCMQCPYMYVYWNMFP